MRTTPRPIIGVLILVAYLIVFYGVWIINGVDYRRIGESATTIFLWYVSPLACGAVVLVIAATVLGWWRPALLEKERAPRWLIVSPAFMAVGAVAILLSKDYSGTTVAMLLLLVVGSLLVGFCEEMATRGLLLVGLRARYTEGWVWFISTLLFGLLHLPNWVFGAGPAAAFQVVLAFAGGTALYLARRTTGSLVWAMLLHGLWDFANFVGTGGGVTAALVWPNGLLALVLVVFALRHTRGRKVEQFSTSREPTAATA